MKQSEYLANLQLATAPRFHQKPVSVAHRASPHLWMAACFLSMATVGIVLAWRG